MTQEKLNEIYQETTRCAQAVMMAFGIKGYPQTGSGCLEYLTANGFELHPIRFKWRNLRHFLEDVRTHLAVETNYLILTPGHAMALVDGFLVDTAKQGWNNRR